MKAAQEARQHGYTDDLRRKPFLIIFWLLVLAAMPVWMSFDAPGWDVAIYHNAIRALAAGHDPYADAIAVQQLFREQTAPHPKVDPPFSYVYSPLTLPLLRLIGIVPDLLSGSLYWLAYAVAVLAQIWVGVWQAKGAERHTILYLAPIAAFFPGLLANGIVLSGNIAYILYAGILLSALIGWRKDTWYLFYLVTLSASCVKAPMLSLVVIPVFSSRRQWAPASATVAAGIACFGMQPFVWPSLFKHYLQAVELQFTYNRDFGCSPAGLFSGFLFDRGIAYAPSAYIFYACYTLPLLCFLYYLSRRFLHGAFSLKQWIPVLLVGTILLNPRLIEYDVAPLTLPLWLIGWRFLRTVVTDSRRMTIFSGFFCITNILALYGWELRKLVDGPLLVLFFILGSWTLLRSSRPTCALSRNCS